MSDKSTRSIKFFKDRHRESGCDYDYLSKLSPDNSKWLDLFTRGYYTGDKKATQALGKAAGLSPDKIQAPTKYLTTGSDRNEKATRPYTPSW